MPSPVTEVSSSKTLRIEVFRSGTFTPMSGEAISYSSDDLAAVAANYDPDNAPAPIVVGHPKTEDEAFGWIDGFEYDGDADRLFATATLGPEFAEAVSDGRYKKVSMSFFRPDASNNPQPGTWYPKHLGFLGAAAPAVSGLKPVRFSEGDDGVVFEAAFGERGFEETAGLFRRMREFFIEKFGRETADDVLPSYAVDWLSEMEIERRGPDVDRPNPSYTEPVMSNPDNTELSDAKLTDREKDLEKREAEFAERQAAARSAEHASFAERMVKEGRVLPANQTRLTELLDALPAGAEVSFSEVEGDKLEDLSGALQSLIAAQPIAVPLGGGRGSESFGDAPDHVDGGASFACDGRDFDRDQLAVDAKAEAFIRENPGTSYLDAVRAVS